MADAVVEQNAAGAVIHAWLEDWSKSLCEPGPGERVDRSLAARAFSSPSKRRAPYGRSCLVIERPREIVARSPRVRAASCTSSARPRPLALASRSNRVPIVAVAGHTSLATAGAP